MIDLNKSIEEFKKYANQYDMTNKSIKMKYDHSFRVMEESKSIAESLKLSQEQTDLATLIGLLHDIARFEQMKRYGTYRDAISIDHGDFGAEILAKNNFIRKFIADDKYDNTIMIAIRNHNKYNIESNLNQEELTQAKIIRDADKLDILYEGTGILWSDQKEIENLCTLKIRDEYFKEFLQGKSIKRKKDQNKLEGVLGFFAFIYDMNYDISLERIKKEDYINRIFDRFNFKEKDTIEKMNEVRKIANEYVQRKK